MKIDCSVHIYKYSQEKRRKVLKKLSKEGSLKYLGRSKTHFYYSILNMEEYKNKKGI